MRIPIESLADITVGALFITLAHDIAMIGNRFAVKIYEWFPPLKKLPRSHLAGTELNYKYLYYFFRVVGTLLLILGILFLGLEMRRL